MDEEGTPLKSIYQQFRKQTVWDVSPPKLLNGFGLTKFQRDRSFPGHCIWDFGGDRPGGSATGAENVVFFVCSQYLSSHSSEATFIGGMCTWRKNTYFIFVRKMAAQLY